MADPRPLRFDNIDAIADDVRRLRAGHTRVGRWTLAQSCLHLNESLAPCLHEPATTELTDAQRQMHARLDGMFAAGAMPAGRPLPPGVEAPAADAGDDAIDAYLAGLAALKAYPHAHADFGPTFGAVAIAPFRAFIAFHAANHLRNYVPTTGVGRRFGLRFADAAAMMDDLNALRAGHTALGRWTLPQIAWHLCLAFPRPIASHATLPPVTDAQAMRQQRWDYYIANVHPPVGFEAPAEMLPPADANDAEIDRLIATLRELFAINDPFVTVAAGAMPIARARGFLLAHGAHHLSYLVPIGTEAAHA